jgi:hypothetical protein
MSYLITSINKSFEIFSIRICTYSDFLSTHRLDYYNLYRGNCNAATLYDVFVKSLRGLDNEKVSITKQIVMKMMDSINRMSF